VGSSWFWPDVPERHGAGGLQAGGGCWALPRMARLERCSYRRPFGVFGDGSDHLRVQSGRIISRPQRRALCTVHGRWCALRRSIRSVEPDPEFVKGSKLPAMFYLQFGNSDIVIP
jgi:hypothetical protein